MVNFERQHNALAALDILARADSTAFKRADSDYAKAKREAKKLGFNFEPVYANGKWQAREKMQYDPKRERAPLSGGSIFGSRNDADERLPSHVAYSGCMIDTSYTKGSNGKKADYYVVSRQNGATPSDLRGRFPTLEAAKAKIDAIKDTARNDAVNSKLSVKDARSYGIEYEKRGNSRARLQEVLRAEGADGDAMRAGLDAFDNA